MTTSGIFEDVAQACTDAGVRRAFVVASIHNLQLLEALAQLGVECVPARSEVGAGHMADGYARASGEPTLLVTSTGPGAGNAVGAFATAAKDGSPVVHLSTSNVIESTAALHHVAEQGYWMQAMGVPYLDLARDGVESLSATLKGGGPASVVVPTRPGGGALWAVPRLPTEAVAADTARVEAALDPWLKSDHRLLWIGGGARSLGRGRLVALAERADAAVVTSVQAKDLFPDDHPLSLACTLQHDEIRQVSAQFDVCLALGSRLTHLSTKAWSAPACPRIIRAGLSAEVPALPGANVEHLRADVVHVASVLDRLLPPAGVLRTGTAVHEARAAIRERRDSGAGAYGFLDALRATLTGEDIVVCDTTKLSFWAMVALGLPAGTRWLFPGLLTMGFGLPAALGAARARPDAHVVALVGDGGLSSMAQELGTAHDSPGRVSVVLADDNGYFVLRPRVNDELGPQLCEFDGPDWAMLAGAYGLPYCDAGDAEGLVAALAPSHRGVRIIRIDARAIGPDWSQG